MKVRQRVVPRFALPPEEDLGPAMRALVPGQRAWVIARLWFGIRGGGETGVAAGYSGASKRVAAGEDWEKAQNPKIQAAMQEEGHRLMGLEGADSIRTLRELRDGGDVPPAVRAKCAIALLDRGGFHAVQQIEAHHHHHLSDSEMDARLKELAGELGWSDEMVQKALIAPALDLRRGEDGVFEEAPKEAEPGRRVTKRMLSVTRRQRDERGAFLPLATSKRALKEARASGDPLAVARAMGVVDAD